MLVKSEQIPSGTKCDVCEKNPALLGHVARGASGRWCEVMWVCYACGCANGPAPISAAEGRERIRAMDAKPNWPDF